MNGYKLILEHRCPQCGAPIELQESDRILRCPFCRVSLYIYFPRHGSYYLPPRQSRQGIPLYVPYWRFRGMNFKWQQKQIHHSLVDYSTRASGNGPFPGSLHYHAQVFKMRLVDPDSEGTYLPLELPMEEIMDKRESTISMSADRTIDPHLLELISPLNGNDEDSYQAFIGDVASLIYAPYYALGDDLYDGLSGAQLTPAAAYSNAMESTKRRDCEYRFFPTLCPNCGWDMECEKDSLILLCSSCNSAWKVLYKGLERQPFSFNGTKQSADLWIPFWRLGVDCNGMKLESYADFIRLTNFPRAVAPWMEQQDLSFWVPAFKINPSHFLSIGSHMMTRQQNDGFTDIPLKCRFHPVTLPALEGFQSAPFLLGATGYARKMLLPKVKDSQFHLRSQELVFVPFVLKGAEYVQPDLQFVLNANALKWGRNI